MDAEIEKLLPLAKRIARDFSNIPGLPLTEIEIQAQEALAAAGRQFDPSKGNFTAYALKRFAMPSEASTSVRFGIITTMPIHWISPPGYSPPRRIWFKIYRPPRRNRLPLRSTAPNPSLPSIRPCPECPTASGGLDRNWSGSQLHGDRRATRHDQARRSQNCHRRHAGPQGESQIPGLRCPRFARALEILPGQRRNKKLIQVTPWLTNRV